MPRRPCSSRTDPHDAALSNLRVALRSLASGAVMKPRRARGGTVRDLGQLVRRMFDLPIAFLPRLARKVKSILRYFGERP